MGKSPAAGDERRPKHFGDDVGGTALSIPSKSLNTVNPGTAVSNGTVRLRQFNTPGVEPLHASHPAWTMPIPTAVPDGQKIVSSFV